MFLGASTSTADNFYTGMSADLKSNTMNCSIALKFLDAKLAAQERTLKRGAARAHLAVLGRTPKERTLPAVTGTSPALSTQLRAPRAPIRYLIHVSVLQRSWSATRRAHRALSALTQVAQWNA